MMGKNSKSNKIIEEKQKKLSEDESIASLADIPEKTVKHHANIYNLL